MRINDLEEFFVDVGARLKFPLRIILTGGVATGFYAQSRFTEDLDFSLQAGSSEKFDDAEKIFQECSQIHGIQLQYSEDIERWGPLSFLNWKTTTKTVGNFGKLKVEALDPLHFSLGKISRATDQDLEDIQAVFSAQKVKGKDVAILWAKALKTSPPSSQLINVRRQMEIFLKRQGAKLWPKEDNLLELFQKKTRA